MILPVLTDRQFTLPAAADGVTLTPPGSSFGNSAWVQVAASLAQDSILTGATLTTALTTAAVVGVELDVGIGAASSEVAVATFRMHYRRNANNVIMGPVATVMSSIGLDVLPSGSRVSVRMRLGSTLTTTWKAAILYLKKPIQGSLLLSTGNLKCSPSAAAPLTSTAGGGVAYTNGLWVQIRAAAGAATWYVVGCALTNNGQIVEFDLGTGAAGLETVVTTLYHAGTSSLNELGHLYPFANPLLIPAGVRLAVRSRSAQLSSVSNFSLAYTETVV